jgi:CRISPR-associated protein Csm1
LNQATKLLKGDYAACNPEGDLKTFEELAVAHVHTRMACCEPIVDNLVQHLWKGFLREQERRAGEVPLIDPVRTATLSRSLSIIFKYYNNDLLDQGKTNYALSFGARK